jgi:hypothetical protein
MGTTAKIKLPLLVENLINPMVLSAENKISA